MPQRVVQHFKKNYKTYAKGLSYGAQALALASKVASLINVEKKFKDTGVLGNVLTPTPQIDLITGIPQGVTVSQREGNSCSMKSIYLRYKLSAGPQSTTPCNVRIMMVHDKNNNNGVAPTAAEILQNFGAENILTHNQTNNKERFKVLMDKLYQIDNTAGIAGTCKTKYFRFGTVDNKVSPPRIYEHKLTWGGTGSGDTQTGHVYMLYFTDAASQQPSFFYNARIKYVDN